ncbi:MAG TPA: GNAT family N-acetyltransferase [Tissierellia bacterium]|jgi:RimJ/RimL family protein N-acetyltransferase|nr:GNAT family N-acetyltransferase [Sedimentibacter sp.]HHZ01078.1 GNAT family N-acetyltransferase [Tissierellia bacterium]
MITLTEIKKEDMEQIYRWFSDPEFLKYYDYYPPNPLKKSDVDKMFRYYKESGKSKVFAVRKDGKIIGLAGFDDIIKENQVATLFIGLGKEDERGKGYGKEALRLLLEYGFRELNFHRIQLNVLEFNNKAIALYERCGFKREGIYREFVLRDGKRHNLLLYGLLRDEWKKIS